MNRRDICLAGIGAAASLATLRSLAEAAQGQNAHLHQSSGHEHHPRGAGSPALAQVARAAAECLTKGLMCADHCVDMLAQGQKDMAECLDRVTDLMAIAEALERMALNHSSHAGAAAKVATTVAIDCAKACDKHRQTMVTCQDCYDACKDLEKACVALG